MTLLFPFISSEILLFIRQWIESCPTDFDSPSSRDNLSLLRPLAAHSAELAKAIEVVGKGPDDAIAVTIESPKG